MITKFLLQLRILPRWVIILLDLFIVALSTTLAYLLRFNFNLGQLASFHAEVGVLINVLSCFLTLIVTKSYAGIVRYTGLKDGLRVFQTLFITHALTTTVNVIYYYNVDRNLIPFSVILISFLASFVFLFQYRLLIKNIFSYYRNLYRPNKRVAIFGAGQMGVITKSLLDNDSEYNVVAFLEDDPHKWGKEINGTLIYGFNKIEKVVNKLSIKEIIIAIEHLSSERKNDIVDACLPLGLEIRTVPSLDTWVKGELSVGQIKNINIDDLLERDSIKLNNERVLEEINEKKVLVTGAAGSIGRELARQVFNYMPAELILVDQSESGLYDVMVELKSYKPTFSVKYYVADVTNTKRIEEIFSRHKPQKIYHAAAYKHVPMMEDNVVEAITCNIFGTKALADAAVNHGVEKFVMVSTDKAVNPTNVMGCSKRIAEMYVQSLNAVQHQTAFVTTRFGNVLGSNGSVIPYFKKQIDSGGPVTVTHPEITRYFMTISEACELVLEAGTMGKGGEIFLFDMGKSVKIFDLAEKMIRLSGLKPHEDVEIVFTGLREGEKLYEELLASKENSLPTHHEKIMVAQVQHSDRTILLQNLELLENAIVEGINEMKLVRHMKQIVPEFISNSSRFEKVDTEILSERH